MTKKTRKPSTIHSGRLINAFVRIPERKGESFDFKDIFNVAGIASNDHGSARQRAKLWCEPGQVIRKKEDDGSITEKPNKMLHERRSFHDSIRKLLANATTPKLDENGEPVLDENGKVVKVRKYPKITENLVLDKVAEFSERIYEAYAIAEENSPSVGRSIELPDDLADLL